jgi:hypothetical protein
MRKEKINKWAVNVVGIFTLVLLLPSVTADGPPFDRAECLAYAYTSSDTHLFLLGDNASMFGSKLMIVHNCEELEIYVDGFFEASSSSNFSIIMEQGNHNISIASNGFNESFSNVFFYPDRLQWEYDFEMIQQKPKQQFIEINLAQLQTNYAVGIGILIVWVLTTYVYWQLISSYVDRNFIEEVSQ